MPANVESMFSVRQMPWHREGTILADYPGDWDEARKLAGLDWDPISTEVYALADLNAGRHPALRAGRRLEVHRPVGQRRSPVDQQGQLHRHRPR